MGVSLKWARIAAVTMETGLLIFCACVDNHVALLFIKAWFIYSIIRHINLSGLPLEPKCPENRDSTVLHMFCIWAITGAHKEKERLTTGITSRNWLWPHFHICRVTKWLNPYTCYTQCRDAVCKHLVASIQESAVSPAITRCDPRVYVEVSRSFSLWAPGYNYMAFPRYEAKKGIWDYSLWLCPHTVLGLYLASFPGLFFLLNCNTRAKKWPGDHCMGTPVRW